MICRNLAHNTMLNVPKSIHPQRLCCFGKWTTSGVEDNTKNHCIVLPWWAPCRYLIATCFKTREGILLFENIQAMLFVNTIRFLSAYYFSIYILGNSNHRASPHRLQMYKVFQEMDFHVITFDYRGIIYS